ARSVEPLIAENHKPTLAANAAYTNQAAPERTTAHGFKPPVSRPKPQMATRPQQKPRTHSTLPSHFAKRIAARSVGKVSRVSSVWRSRSRLIRLAALIATITSRKLPSQVPKCRTQG